MKASELRIGNLIYQDGEVTEVLRLNSTMINSSSEDDCSGTPLTEEWLIKFGFEKGSVFMKNEIKIGRDGDDFIHGLYSVPYDGNMLKVAYVHQLQNLYFALTGTELTINP
jgi:hypothetical protein